jgi:hypothetical protein
MPYIYTITSDERLVKLFSEFDKASKEAFEEDEGKGFEAIQLALEYRDQLLERLKELDGSEKPKLIDPKIIDNKDNDQILIGRLAALLLGKTDLGEFILHNQDKMGEGLKGMLKDIEHKTKANQYVLFWLVSEEDLDGII